VVPNANWFITTFFNWTLNFRNQAYEEMLAEGHDVTNYDRNNLMEIQSMMIQTCHRADDKIRTFQMDSAREAGFSIIILPTYHTTASYE
jgi:isocitrate lyase